MLALALMLFFGHKDKLTVEDRRDRATYDDVVALAYEAAGSYPALIDPYVIDVVKDVQQLELETRKSKAWQVDHDKLAGDVTSLIYEEHVIDVSEII